MVRGEPRRRSSPSRLRMHGLSRAFCFCSFSEFSSARRLLSCGPTAEIVCVLFGVFLILFFESSTSLPPGCRHASVERAECASLVPCARRRYMMYACAVAFLSCAPSFSKFLNKMQRGWREGGRDGAGGGWTVVGLGEGTRLSSSSSLQSHGRCPRIIIIHPLSGPRTGVPSSWFHSSWAV